MNVLVDTSIWSLALRRGRRAAPEAREMRRLIADFRVALAGPVRQEVLSGIRDAAQYESLRTHLRAFPDVALLEEDYERAASFFNRCRTAGVQGSNTDFLLCAIADRRGWSVFTADQDFQRFAPHIPLRLHSG